MPFFLFLICCLLFIIHQFGIIYIPTATIFIDGYLDPLLLMPIMLWLVMWEQRLFFKKPPDYTLPTVTIIKLTLSVAFISEVIFPICSPRFTADFLDVLCYIFGSCFYYFLMNKK